MQIPGHPEGNAAPAGGEEELGSGHELEAELPGQLRASRSHSTKALTTSLGASMAARGWKLAARGSLEAFGEKWRVFRSQW